METEVTVALITGGVTLINIIFSGIINFITKKQAEKIAKQNKCQEQFQLKMDEQSGRISNLEDGLQALLRIEIIRSHDKYMERKYCPVYAKESLSRAYNAYHTLGGNDVATELYHKVIELPISPPDDDENEE